MNKRINISSAFKVLFNGGYIIKERRQNEKRIYSVMKWSSVYGRPTFIGQIKEKDFRVLESILKCFKCESGDYIGQYLFYELDWSKSNTAYFPASISNIKEEKSNGNIGIQKES